MVITTGWLLAITYKRPYVTIIDEIEKYGNPDTRRETVAGAYCFSDVRRSDLTITRLFETVWNNRELTTVTKQWPGPKKSPVTRVLQHRRGVTGWKASSRSRNETKNRLVSLRTFLEAT